MPGSERTASSISIARLMESQGLSEDELFAPRPEELPRIRNGTVTLLPVEEKQRVLDLLQLTLTDESQQYGNIEETSVVARTPRTCLKVWAWDHRQTPGGLKKTDEARRFRQKLMKRPLALRCGTSYIQPHELHTVVERYLDGPVDSPSHSLCLLLSDEVAPMESRHITAVTQLWSELLGLIYGLTHPCASLPLPFCG